jgi:hypothetical protein
MPVGGLAGPPVPGLPVSRGSPCPPSRENTPDQCPCSQSDCHRLVWIAPNDFVSSLGPGQGLATNLSGKFLGIGKSRVQPFPDISHFRASYISRGHQQRTRIGGQGVDIVSLMSMFAHIKVPFLVSIFVYTISCSEPDAMKLPFIENPAFARFSSKSQQIQISGLTHTTASDFAICNAPRLSTFG